MKQVGTENVLKKNALKQVCDVSGAGVTLESYALDLGCKWVALAICVVIGVLLT